MRAPSRATVPITYRIFGPDGGGLFPKTSRFVDLLVGDGGAFPYQRTFGADEKFIVKDLAINLDSPQTTILDDHGLLIEEIATHHGDCPSVAYRITYKGVTLVYSGDMDASALPNLVHLAKNADLLIFNCAVLDPPQSPSQLYELHTPPRKIGEAAHQSRVKSLLLSHTALRRRKPRDRGAQFDSHELLRAGSIRHRPPTRESRRQLSRTGSHVTLRLCLSARVAELADAPDSKSGGRKAVWVRFPPRAPFIFLRRPIARTNNSLLQGEHHEEPHAGK